MIFSEGRLITIDEIDEEFEDFGLYFFEEIGLLEHSQIDFIDGKAH